MKKVTPKTSKKPASKSAKAPVKAEAKPVPAPAPKPIIKIKMSPKDKAELRGNLLALRERLTGQIAALRDESLTREQADNTVEDGTDAFERQVSLNLVSSENEEVMAIDDAMRRLEEGSYGVCQECGCGIEKARLKALPFVGMCVKCQTESEKGKSRFRPLSSDTTM